MNKNIGAYVQVCKILEWRGISGNCDRHVYSPEFVPERIHRAMIYPERLDSYIRILENNSRLDFMGVDFVSRIVRRLQAIHPFADIFPVRIDDLVGH